jgi:hypothetical protein
MRRGIYSPAVIATGARSQFQWALYIRRLIHSPADVATGARSQFKPTQF